MFARIIKKIFIVLVMVAIVGGAVLYLYSDALINSAVVKKYLSGLIHQEVDFARVRINIFSGIELRDLRIIDDTGPMITAHKLVLSYDLFQVLLGRLELSEIILVKPELQLRHLADNRFNITPIFDALTIPAGDPGSTGYQPGRVRITALTVQDGTIRYKPLAALPRNMNQISFSGVEGTISGITEVIRRFSFTVHAVNQVPVEWSMTGTMTARSGAGNIRLQAEGDYSGPASLFLAGAASQFITAKTRLKANFQGEYDHDNIIIRKFEYRLTDAKYQDELLKNDNFTIKGFASGNYHAGVLNVKDFTAATGKMKGSGQGTISWLTEAPEYNYTARMTGPTEEWYRLRQEPDPGYVLENGEIHVHITSGRQNSTTVLLKGISVSELRSLPFARQGRVPARIDNIHGQISVQPGRAGRQPGLKPGATGEIRFDNLTGEIMDGIKISCLGELDRENNVSVQIRLQPTELTDYLAFLPPAVSDKLTGYRLSGLAAATIEYRGVLNEPVDLERLRLSADISGLSVEALAPDNNIIRKPISFPALNLVYQDRRCTFDRQSGHIGTNRFHIQEGWLDLSDSRPEMYLKFTTDKMKFDEALAAINRRYSANLSDFDLDGEISAKGVVSGSLDNLNYGVQIFMDKGTVFSPKFPALLRNVSLEMDIMPDRLNIRKAGFSLGDNQLSLTGTVTDFKTRRLALQVSGTRMDLATLQSVLSVDTTVQPRGTVNFNLTITGTMDQPEYSGALEFIEASLDLEPFGLPRPTRSAPAALTDLKGEIKIDPDQILFKALKGNILDNEVTIIGIIDRLRSGFDGTEMNIDITARKISVPQLLNLLGVATTDHSSGYLSLSLQATGPVKRPAIAARLAGTHVKLFTVPLTTFSTDIKYRGQELVMERIRGNCFSGELTGQVTVNNIFQPAQNLAMELKLERAKLYDMFRNYESEYASGVEGEVNVQLALRGPLATRDQLTGGGELEMIQPRLRNFHPLIRLSDLMGLSGTKMTYYEDIKAKLVIGNNRVETPDLRFRSQYITGTGSGGIGFDQSITYDLILRMNRESAGEFLDANYNAKLDENMTAVEEYLTRVPVVIRGTVTEPEVSYGDRGFPEMLGKSLLYYTGEGLKKGLKFMGKLFSTVTGDGK